MSVGTKRTRMGLALCPLGGGTARIQTAIGPKWFANRSIAPRIRIWETVDSQSLGSPDCSALFTLSTTRLRLTEGEGRRHSIRKRTPKMLSLLLMALQGRLINPFPIYPTSFYPTSFSRGVAVGAQSPILRVRFIGGRGSGRARNLAAHSAPPTFDGTVARSIARPGGRRLSTATEPATAENINFTDRARRNDSRR